MKRRDMVKATVGVAAAAASGVVAFNGTGLGTPRAAAEGTGAGAVAAGPADHVETYKGRTIRVAESGGEHTAVFIDDRPLHVMKLGENAYMSSLCHYGLEASPLVAARRAVDELRGAQLLAAKASGTSDHHHAA
ncbi:tyrosinase family oxidase copper chaperone [Kitasatospora sp. NPDC057015]|uniref:tyrosinase family oxidase copper chaperone n=1 Tax=Kitasatospora sp. NPDC057015 TaxID=3346001 RepID=UPI0036409A9A